MISYIKGVIDTVEHDKVIIENNNMGYNVLMSQSATEALGQGEEIKIYTYLHVKEDAMQLFGFLTKDDLEIFRLVIGVSGIGPKGGLNFVMYVSG